MLIRTCVCARVRTHTYTGTHAHTHSKSQLHRRLRQKDCCLVQANLGNMAKPHLKENKTKMLYFINVQISKDSKLAHELNTSMAKTLCIQNVHVQAIILLGKFLKELFCWGQTCHVLQVLTWTLHLEPDLQI